MAAGAPNCAPTTAAPVVGYFLDHANYAQQAPSRIETPAAAVPTRADYPSQGNYSSWMSVVFRDQNVSGSLYPECLAAFPDTPHLCFMSPHMVRFVKAPFFMFNSRFDAWQMDNDLQVPCRAGEAKHKPCNSREQSAIVQYGADFLDALKPVIASAPKNGAFITSCICHSCSWSTLTTGVDTLTSYAHYAAWFKNHTPDRSSTRSIHIDSRAPNGGGTLKDPKCMPFPELAAAHNPPGQAGRRRLQLPQVNVALFDDENCERRVGTRGPFTSQLCTELSDDTSVLYRYDRSSRQALRRFHYDSISCEDGSPSHSSAMSFTRCTPTEGGRSEQLTEDELTFNNSASDSPLKSPALKSDDNDKSPPSLEVPAAYQSANGYTIDVMDRALGPV
jgi:hypothetical protein